jgi:hypothetical protein
MSKKHYSANLSISIVDIEAGSEEEAEAIMNNFIEEIGPVMADEICWDRFDFSVEEMKG